MSRAKKVIRIGSKSMNVARANICRGYSLAEKVKVSAYFFL